MKQLQFKSYDEIAKYWSDALENSESKRWAFCGYFENLDPLENTVKSFYGKAKTVTRATTSDDYGEALDRFEVSLLSYDTVIARIVFDSDGCAYFQRECLDEALTQTTLRHIKAFCGMNKAQFSALRIGELFPL